MEQKSKATTVRINEDILYLLEELVIKKVQERHQVLSRTDIVYEAIKMYAEKEGIKPKAENKSNNKNPKKIIMSSPQKFQEEVIRRWFNDNRPDFEVDFYLIKFILESLEESLKTSEETPDAQRTIIVEYLTTNYDTRISDIIKEIIAEKSREDEAFAETIKDWRGMGIINSEIGTIYKNIVLKEIPEKHLTFDDGMGYDDSIREAIEEVVVSYVKKW